MAQRRFFGHSRVDRKRAAKRDGDQNDGRQWGEQPYRFKRDRWLITERAEVIDTGEAHHPQPKALVMRRVENLRGWRELAHVGHVGGAIAFRVGKLRPEISRTGRSRGHFGLPLEAFAAW